MGMAEAGGLPAVDAAASGSGSSRSTARSCAIHGKRACVRGDHTSDTGTKARSIEASSRMIHPPGGWNSFSAASYSPSTAWSTSASRGK